MRAIFFDEEHAAAAVARLRRDGYAADVQRERLAGEDDDEDHPWAVLSDAPLVALELLVDAYDGWLDADDEVGPGDAPVRPRMVDQVDGRPVEGIQRVADDVRSFKFVPGLGQDFGAQSSATLPLPMTAACVPFKSGERDQRNRGGHCTSRRIRADPTTPGKSSPGMPSLRSCGAPMARITAS